MTSTANPKAVLSFQRRIRTVLQEDSNGCGVACLAMVAGVDYQAARETFVRLGYSKHRKGKPPFASNFTELMNALKEHGIQSRMKRWDSWKRLDGLGILKIENGVRNSWHWVVARPHPDLKVVIHDPNQTSVTILQSSVESECAPRSELAPYGSWIRIL